MTTQEDDEYTKCLTVLAAWVKTKKNELYDKNIKSPANQENVLANFEKECGLLGELLLQNLNSENEDTLRKLGWPEDLMECIKHPDVRWVLCDEVENWFIRYPFVRSKLHLEEMERENAGVN